MKSACSAPAFAQSDAIILDLDGVITRTAEVHAASWKELFDEFLQRWSARESADQPPFDIETDYRRYVDGKPRYAGVQSFLGSRQIDLPYGDPRDPADLETVCGLGNRKNDIFRKRVARDGVEVFETSVELVRHLRSRGLKTALVSSSKNARAILDAAGISELFDVCVDGVDAERRGLKGKPDPETFVYAASLLGIEPLRAAAVEDALSGVEAADAAGCGLVIGVDRSGQAESLLARGADIVVSDLGELCQPIAAESSQLPNAIDCFAEITGQLSMKRLAVMLDYDGTLTPIVARPELAILTDRIRGILRKLSASCTVAVISGRDRVDVEHLVGLKELIFAGSHGFDIAGPAGLQKQHDQAAELTSWLDRAETALKAELATIEGAIVERKRYAIAVHYRLVDPPEVALVEAAVDRAVGKASHKLRKTGGKKVFEIRPNLPWDKGQAALWLLETLELKGANALPIYIGDDETDEDAFIALRGIGGVGIRVDDRSHSTFAQYVLKDPQQVGDFLDRLADAAEARSCGQVEDAS